MSKSTTLSRQSATESEADTMTPQAFTVFKERFFDHIPLPAWCISTDGRQVIANQCWCETMAELPVTGPHHWLDWVHPEDQPAISVAWAETLHNNTHFQHHIRLATGNEQYGWFIVYAYLIPSPECRMVKFFDINDVQMEKFRARDELCYSSRMFDTSIDCIKIISTGGELIDVNTYGCQVLGLDRASVAGMSWPDMLPAESRQCGIDSLEAAVGGTSARFSYKSQLPGRAPLFWDNILTPVLDAEGQVSRVLCVSRDITRLQIAEQRFKYISEHDDLTGLPNRRVFHSALKKQFSTASLQGSSFAVLLLDLDDFNVVNDTLGYLAGDNLLAVLARRLTRNLPKNSFIARIGGDQFAVIVPDIDNSEILHQTCTQLTEQVCQAVSFQGHTLNFSLSIGGAIFPQHGRESIELIKAADTALNELKRTGYGGVCCFEPAMTRQVDITRNQLELAKEIVRNESVVPFYQPKVRLTDGKIIGIEALMRFYSQQGELHSPGDIWAAFSKYGLAERIGFFIRDQVFSDMRQWIDQGLEIVPVSVNASPVEFMRDDYAEKFLAQLQKYALPANLLEVEITEHMFDGRGAGYVFRAIKLLKAQGVRIALDDFGTGYSALANIRDYPVDVIKVDRSFVRGLSKGKKGLAVIKALLLLATQLELDVVAEGIEDAEQRALLINEGYHYGQGFLFSAAVPALQIREYLQSPDTRKLL